MKAIAAEIVTQGGVLEAREVQQLKAGEEDIAKGGSLIVAAMAIIRNQHLYRATHDSFESYCRERWNRTASGVHDAIATEAVVQRVAECLIESDSKNFGVANSRISRGAAKEVADLPPQTAAEVVRTVVKQGQKPTAANLKAARETAAPKITGGNTFDPQELDAAPASPASPTVMTDAINRPVPSKLNAACSAAAALESLARKVDPIRREAESMAEKDGGDFLEMATVNKLCRELKTAIGHAAYWTACPRCKGKSCDRCKVGWIPKCQSGHLSADDKAALGLT